MGVSENEMFLAEYPIREEKNWCDICSGEKETIPGAFVDETGLSVGYYCLGCQRTSRMVWHLQLKRIKDIERKLEENGTRRMKNEL